jgi:hypothetical protein
MSHRSAVTFDTICLTLFFSCVLSFRLSLRLFYVFLLFLISTSRHNTTNFLSLTQQQQQQPYTLTPEQQQQQPPRPPFPIALKYHLKHEKRKQKQKTKTKTKRRNSH